MAELLAPHALERPDDAALIDEHRTITWGELNERVNRLVSGLRAAGAEDHDTVALMVGNRGEFFEVFAAAAHARWVVVPVNWHWVADELAYVLENSGATTVIVEEAYLDVARSARLDPRTAGVRRWLIADRGAVAVDAFDTLDAVAAAGSPDEPADQGMGGPMFYTSGTTGFPKGVKSSLSSTEMPTVMLSLISGSFCGMLGLPTDGVTFLNGPAYHSAQWVFSMFPLLNGATVVMRHRFDPTETLAVIDGYQVTNTHFVPTQFVRMLKLPDDVRAGFDGSSLTAVFHGAAPCSHEVKRQILDWFGPVVHEYYGGTEGGFISLIRGDEWLDRPGSLGRTVDIIEVMIVDSDSQALPAGETGQIYFRNIMGSDFSYHGDEEKTAAAHLSDGWGTLGDIGYLDADGYLFLSDRKIDMIISGGVNIYPAEIEGVLVSHPSVADAAVFGIPHDEMGEQVMAVVELVEDVTASSDLADELVRLCREKLAGYKAPRSLEFTAALPRTPTGKLTKRLLRDPYWEGTARSI